MNNENDIETLKAELRALKDNNRELIARCNAAIASWDEERERALREADRVIDYQKKYKELKEYFRFIGKQIPCNTGGTFENDPIDAIFDAVIRTLGTQKKEINYITDASDKTLKSLDWHVKRANTFEKLAEMLYTSTYDDRDTVKQIYRAVKSQYDNANREDVL